VSHGGTGLGGGRLYAWLHQSDGMESCAGCYARATQPPYRAQAFRDLAALCEAVSSPTNSGR
jgi:hypothetical protein